MSKLHALHIPIIAPVPAPTGFCPVSVVTNSYDKTYRIVYQNSAGATITFEANQLYAGSAKVAAAATPAARPKGGHGLFQRLFGGPNNAGSEQLASNGERTSSTSGETEAQATNAALPADSDLIGPIRFTASGPCLQGTADGSKAQIHGLRVKVSGCNFDDPDVLISAYKHVKRV